MSLRAHIHRAILQGEVYGLLQQSPGLLTLFLVVGRQRQVELSPYPLLDVLGHAVLLVLLVHPQQQGLQRERVVTGEGAVSALNGHSEERGPHTLAFVLDLVGAARDRFKLEVFRENLRTLLPGPRESASAVETLQVVPLIAFHAEHRDVQRFVEAIAATVGLTDHGATLN